MQVRWCGEKHESLRSVYAALVAGCTCECDGGLYLLVCAGCECAGGVYL